MMSLGNIAGRIAALGLLSSLSLVAACGAAPEGNVDSQSADLYHATICGPGYVKDCSGEGPQGQMICSCVGDPTYTDPTSQCSADTGTRPSFLSACGLGTIYTVPSDQYGGGGTVRVWTCPAGTPLQENLPIANSTYVLVYDQVDVIGPTGTAPANIPACGNGGFPGYECYMASSKLVSCLTAPPNGYALVVEWAAPTGKLDIGSGCRGPCEVGP
jgi:hypothetical protein